jgi:bacillolysin/thermolysin
MNKKLTALVMAAAMVASTVTAFGTTNIARAKSLDIKAKAIGQMQQLSNGKLTYMVSENNGQQTLLSGRLSEKKTASAEEALNFVQANSEVFGIADGTSLQVVSVQKDELGFTHVKFNQVINGIPVEGRELAVHFDNNGYVVNAGGNVETTLSIAKKGSKNLSAAEAINEAKNGFVNKNLKAEPKADKVMLVQNGQAFEAYKVNVQYNNPIANYDVYVDVTTGDILNISDNIRYDGAVVGSGKLVNGQTKALNLYLSGTTRKN